MNIDIRDIDSDFESDIKNIMQDNSIATASKAVRHAVTQHSRLNFEIESLRRKLLTAQTENKQLATFKDRVFDFMNLFKDNNDGK